MPPSLPAHPHQRVDHADTIGQDEQRVDLDLQDIATLPTDERGEPRQRVHHLLDQETVGGRTSRTSPSRTPAHLLDQETVGGRTGVVAKHVDTDPDDRCLHPRRTRNSQRDGAGLGLVGQTVAQHLHGDRKADLRRDFRVASMV